MTQRIRINPWAYTGKSRTGQRDGYVPYTGDSVNIDTHRGFGEPWDSRGYKIHRLMTEGANNSCASWLHTHTDGGSTPVYYLNDSLYPETGSDSPSAFSTGALTETFKPVFVSMPFPFGGSVWFNGVNGQAQLIREDGASALEAVLFDYAVPSGVTCTPQTTGGSLADGTYHVMVTMEDTGGAVTVETYPQIFTSVVISGGGGSGSLDIGIGSATYGARTVNYKTYVSSTTTAASSHLLEATTVKGTATTTITALSGTETIAHINEVLRQSGLPINAVEGAWLHQGRMFVSSSSSNKVYFSERDNINHWYSTNEVTAGAESGWSDGVIGGISAFGVCYVFTRRSIHRVVGDLTRDDQGTSASYILNVGQDIISTNFGLVGPNAVVLVGNVVYFLSEQGLAGLQGASVGIVSPDDEPGQLDCVDILFLSNAVLAEDPQGYLCVLVARLANSARPMDGASVTGIPDRIYRWDLRHRVWAPPLALGDLTHIVARPNTTAGGTSTKIRLMAGSPTGRVFQLNYGRSGGGPDDVSGTLYDGQTGTTPTTTTEVFVRAGVVADQFNGMTVTLKYPDGDTVYPGQTAQKTITDTAVSGSDVTITWKGALTVPSASGVWTVRIAGYVKKGDLALDMRQVVDIPAGSKMRIMSVRYLHQHVIGVEATS